MKTTLLNDKIIIDFHSYFSLILLLIGGLLLLTGIILLGKVPEKIKYLLPIFGGMFFLTGVLVWYSSYKIQVAIDKKMQQVLITEKVKGQELQSSIPLKNFRQIEIHKKVSLHKNSSGTTQKSITYSVHLRQYNGSSILLISYGNLNRLYNFVKALKKIVSLDIVVFSGSDPALVDVLDKMKSIEGVRVVQDTKEMITAFQKGTTTAPQLSLPKYSTVHFVKAQGMDTVTWPTQSSLVVVGLIGGVLAGFFALLHLLVIPDKGFSLPVIIGYGILVVVGILWLLMLLAALFGKSMLTINRQEVVYQTQIAGIQTYHQRLNLQEIHALYSSINQSEDKTLQLFTEKGNDLMERMMRQPPENIGMELFQVLMDYKSYLMSVDVSTFTIGERLKLEQVISQRISRARE